MIIQMKLFEDPFEKILTGKKTIELRLYDKKRRGIDLGDIIVFNKTAEHCDQIATKVTALYRSNSFKELFQDIPLEKCGFNKALTANEAAIEMERYYSQEEIALFGVIGIRFELIDLEKVKSDYEADQLDAFEKYFPDGMK